MMNNLNIGIIFGGKSAEHEISLKSAWNIIEGIDKSKYTIRLIFIDKQGTWFLCNAGSSIEQILESKKIELSVKPGDNTIKPVFHSEDDKEMPIDVVFPVLHGTCGEDGTIQGLFKLMNIPFVGAGVLGSAVGMDKDVMKRLLKEANIPIARFKVFNRSEIDKINYDQLQKELGSTFFIKPCNLGSSVGISKVISNQQLKAAINRAFLYDRKILIEENIPGREIECSVLGNQNPEASLPGEIITKADFYSYEAKYIDSDVSTLELPAKLDQNLTQTVRELAVKSYKTLCCEGLARVDFFLTKDNKVIVNEINTLPGFTQISMYPKLWELSKKPIAELIDELIQFALKRFNEERCLKTSF